MMMEKSNNVRFFADNFITKTKKDNRMKKESINSLFETKGDLVPKSAKEMEADFVASIRTYERYKDQGRPGSELNQKIREIYYAVFNEEPLNLPLAPETYILTASDERYIRHMLELIVEISGDDELPVKIMCGVKTMLVYADSSKATAETVLTPIVSGEQHR